MRTLAACALTLAVASGIQAEANAEQYTWLSRTKQNRLSTRYGEGDARYASCKLHKGRDMRSYFAEEYMRGVVWAEQKWNTGTSEWDNVNAYAVIKRAGSNAGSTYALFNYYIEDYNQLECFIEPSVSPTIESSNPSTGRSADANGMIALSTLDGSIVGSTFGKPYDALTRNVVQNELFNTVTVL